MPVFVSPESGQTRALFDWLREKRQPTPERYLHAMAILELLWRETIPGLSFRIVHEDSEHLPEKSTWTAMAIFAVLAENPTAQKWFAKHIRNAVVHSASAADGISLIGDSIHFYEVNKLAEDLGGRLFDKLPSVQRMILRDCMPAATHDRSLRPC